MNTTSNQQPNVVCFGEILWDILPNALLPGGAPMNVAYHLKQLGQHPAMISKIGNDEKGQAILQVLQEKGIDTRFVQTDKEHQTGVVYATPNEQHEMQYEIVQPVAWDFISNIAELSSLVTQADYFLFGSLASRMEVSRSTLFSLLEKAKTKVLDINLRPPHFSQDFVETLLYKADVLKMNENELQLISSWYNHTADQEEQITVLQNQFQLSTIIVTLGSNGAVVKNDASFYRHAGFSIKVADTIGSGDSFLAAYLSKTIEGETHDVALNFACGLGALVASKNGGCPSYAISEIDTLIKK